MSESVEASLQIGLYVDCPECDEMMDLMDSDLNEEGAINMQALPSGDWHEPHRNFSEKIECPNCNHNIIVKGIAW